MDRSILPGRIRGICISPGSKSYAQRALAASLLTEGTTVLHHLDFCKDTLSAIHCIESLGAKVRRADDRTLIVEGGLHPSTDRLDVGESGLAARLFAPIASLCHTPMRIEGEGTLLHRPMLPMIETLRQFGVRVRDGGGFLPIEVCGPLRGSEVTIDGSISSQFATGLLLALPLARQETTIHIVRPVATPYLDMTIDTARQFGIEILHKDYREFYIPGGQCYHPAEIDIESDWSAAALLLVAGAVAGQVTVRHLPTLSKQADTVVMEALVHAGAAVIDEGDTVTVSHRPLQAFTFDATLCPDLFPALATLAAAADGMSVIRGTSRLENRESKPGRDAQGGVREARYRDRSRRRGYNEGARRKDPWRKSRQPRRPPHRHGPCDRRPDCRGARHHRGGPNAWPRVSPTFSNASTRSASADGHGNTSRGHSAAHIAAHPPLRGAGGTADRPHRRYGAGTDHADRPCVGA